MNFTMYTVFAFSHPFWDKVFAFSHPKKLDIGNWEKNSLPNNNKNKNKNNNTFLSLICRLRRR